MKQFSSCIFGAILLLWTNLAWAYIDPGSGSALMSAIIGFFLAVSITVKTYWYKIRSLFGVNKRRKPSENEKPNEDD